jgi:hypothetical protein
VKGEGRSRRGRKNEWGGKGKGEAREGEEGGREGGREGGKEKGGRGPPDFDGAVAQVEDVEGVVQVFGREGVDGKDTVGAKVASVGGREGGGRKEGSKMVV